jgi:uncharacterized protein (TIGR00730 family)
MKISFFGGSRADKETCKLAYQLGQKIAQKGHTLVNGGGPGAMEAIAKGAFEEGGKVISLTIADSAILTLGYRHKYTTKLIEFKDYSRRIKDFLKSDRFIILPGQIGTIEEFLIVWIETITKNLKPIILMGKRNKKLIDFLVSNGYVKKDEHLPYIQYAKTIKDIDFLI